MVNSRYFKESEFQKCTPSCSLQDMNQSFINKLDTLRDVSGVPLVLNCAYRSKEHDRAKGRSGTGDHPQRKGVDIRCNNSDTRYKILNAAIKVGFTRIGIAKNFIHVGDGDNLPREVVWMY